MKNLLVIFSLLIGFLVSSCKQNLIEATTPKAAKNAKEAKARLVGVKKWKLSEMAVNGIMVYSKGVLLDDDFSIDEMYMVFKENGDLELNYENEPVEILKYKIDEVKNTLTIIDASGENGDYIEDWTIEAGSVFKDSFEISYSYKFESEADVKFRIKMEVFK
jgi:hypothetical protein